MGVSDHQFVVEQKALVTSLEGIASGPEVVLPEVPERMLHRVFQHMSVAERDFALQQRLVPVTWLPHFTLYADAAPSRHWKPVAPSAHVVARIDPGRFQEAVRKYLRRELADAAAFNLRRKAPVFSAHQRLSGHQKRLATAGLLVFAVLSLLLPFQILYAGESLVLTAVFLAMVWLRLLALTEAAATPPYIPERDNSKLPVYSVLVPVFREISVLPQLLSALRSLDYPQDKLDIKLILEETDTAMQRAVSKLALPSFIEVLVVPAGKPQTKPRALNYALHFARGSLLTIYDAEDIPDPMQLRLAVRAFATQPQELGCLQAELAFYNPNENWLTRGIMAQTPQGQTVH